MYEQNNTIKWTASGVHTDLNGTCYRNHTTARHTVEALLPVWSASLNVIYRWSTFTGTDW